MSKSLFVYCVTIVLLAGCASSGDKLDRDQSVRQQSEINTQLGREYMARGQYEIALEKLKKASNADPAYAPAHTMLAVLYKRLGDLELAGQHYRLAVDAAPADGDVNNNYGVFLCQSGHPERAGPYFARAVDDPFYRTPAVALANAGACELQSGHLDKAVSFLRQSLEYEAEFADALLPLANVYYLSGEYFRARAFLQRYESVGPDTAESLDLGFQIETGLENSTSAFEYQQKLLTRFPQSQQAEQMRGRPQ